MTLAWAETPLETTLLADWAAQRIPQMHGGDFGPCVAGGVMRDGELCAVVVFHEYQPSYATMQVSIAAERPGWATRGVLREMFAYAFQTVGVYLLWAVMAADNARAIAFNRRLGFRREAVLRHRFGPGRHAVVASMTRGAWQNSRWR